MDDDEDRDAQPCCHRRSSLPVAVTVHSSMGRVGVQTDRVFSRPEHFHGTQEEIAALGRAIRRKTVRHSFLEGGRFARE
jgi:hypothetical protein